MTITNFDDLQRYRSKIIQIASNYKGQNVRAFGDILQDDFHSGNEIQLIIEFECLISHGKHIRLERTLEKLLGHHYVKVIDPAEEPEDKREQMLKEAVPL